MGTLFEESMSRMPERVYMPGEIRGPFDYQNIMMSQEAYFGDNNSFKTEFVSHCKELKEVMMELKDNTNKSDIDVDLEVLGGLTLNKTIDKIKDCIKRNLNVENVDFGIFFPEDGSINAFSVPVCWDRELINQKTPEGKNKRLKKLNEDVVADLEDIVEGKNGYRFKNPKGKMMIYAIADTMITDPKMTPEMIAAILFHEMGHSMEHMLAGVNAQIADRQFLSSMSGIHQLLNPIFIILGMGAPLILAPILSAITKKKDFTDEKEVSSAIDDMMKDGFGKRIGRKKVSEELVNEEVMNESLSEIAEVKKRTFLGVMIKTVFFVYENLSILASIVKVGFAKTGIGLLLQAPQLIFVAANYGELRKERKYEQFADTFATAYGLGKDMTRALAVIGNKYEKCDLGAFTFLNYVPLLNVALAAGDAMGKMQSQLMAGYPSSKKRIVGQYKILQYELANNKTLSSQDKKDILAQLDDIKEIYDEYICGDGAKGFSYKLFHKVTKASIDNESSDIIENVADVINDYKKEVDISKIKSDKKITDGAVANFSKGFGNIAAAFKK